MCSGTEPLPEFGMAVVKGLVHRISLDSKLLGDLSRSQAAPVPKVEHLALSLRKIGEEGSQVVVGLPISEGVGRSEFPIVWERELLGARGEAAQGPLRDHPDGNS